MRSASRPIASFAVRSATSTVISSACAWCGIIPCRNLTSASVNRIPARSDASSAVISRLGSPGAPGCTIGTCARLAGAANVSNAAQTAVVTTSGAGRVLSKAMVVSVGVDWGCCLCRRILPAGRRAVTYTGNRGPQDRRYATVTWPNVAHLRPQRSRDA